MLRNVYSYREGGTAWDAFPEDWRRIARENARAALVDLVNSIGTYPSRMDLANVNVPVVCSYGARSPASMFRLTRRLSSAIPTARIHRIEGAGHAAPFDATTNFVRLIADLIISQHGWTVREDSTYAPPTHVPEDVEGCLPSLKAVS